jgi:hypothetical protein
VRGREEPAEEPMFDQGEDVGTDPETEEPLSPQEVERRCEDEEQFTRRESGRDLGETSAT